MFGLFKKKKEEEEVRSAPQPQDEALRTLAEQFLPEELDVLAVTGASGFSGAKLPDKEMWAAAMELTAWMEEDAPDIHRGETQLVTLADEKLMSYLRQRVPRDFILQFKARLSQDGKRLLMLTLPRPGFDPDLKAILDEQKKPVSVWVPDLGTFTLNRALGWFQADVEWLGQSVQLVYDQGSEEEMKAAQDTAKALMGGQEDWDGRVRAFAVEQLQAQYAGGEDELASLPAGELSRRLELESVQVRGGGSFEFWFHDGDYVSQRAVRVTGSLQEGPAGAELDG